MSDPKPINVQQARDLLLPGMYRFDRQGDLRADRERDAVIYSPKDGADRVVLTGKELDRPDWAKIAKERLGWPT